MLLNQDNDCVFIRSKHSFHPLPEPHEGTLITSLSGYFSTVLGWNKGYICPGRGIQLMVQALVPTILFITQDHWQLHWQEQPSDTAHFNKRNTNEGGLGPGKHWSQLIQSTCHWGSPDSQAHLLCSITLHRGTASGVSFSALTHIQAQDGRLSLLFVLQSFHQHKAPLLCVSKPGQPSRAWA